MECTISSTAGLTDAALVAEVTRLAGRERRAVAELIASLAEFDARRLYLQAGCSSLFTYCTRVLHLSEHAAYGRIEAARAARRCPVILERLADGSITLTTVCLMGKLLTADNCEALLSAAHHKSKREVEQLVATMQPQAALPSFVRKLSGPRTWLSLGAQRPTERGGTEPETADRSTAVATPAEPTVSGHDDPYCAASSDGRPRPGARAIQATGHDVAGDA